MKQTQNTLAKERAAAYSPARGVAEAVTGESGEKAACPLVREGRRQQSHG